MSISLNPSTFSECRPFSEQTARNMVEALKDSFNDKCSLLYNEQTKTFTILNSKEISSEKITEAFATRLYDGWQPKIKKSTDNEGNKRINLILYTASDEYRDFSYPDVSSNAVAIYDNKEGSFEEQLHNVSYWSRSLT